MSKCCSHGTLLHFSLHSSQLNICYYHQDLHQKSLHPGSHHRIRNNPCAPLLTTGRCPMKTLYQSHAWAPSIFGASPFGRWVVTHSLADFDFHDHRPAVQMNQHPLWYLMSVWLSTLTLHQVHPSSPVLLTKNGPLKIMHSTNNFKVERHWAYPFKVWE